MTSLMEALKKLYRGGDAQAEEAPPPMGPPVNPWHPPMIMPNVPRNPDKDKRMPDSFLKGKTAADFGQDPMAEPLPDRTQMAKLTGAVRMPAPEREAPMSPKDFGNISLDDPKGLVPEGMSRADFTKEGPSGVGNVPDDDVVRVTPSSYFDVGAHAPSEPAMSLPDLPEIGAEMPPEEDPSYEQTQPQPEANPSSAGSQDQGSDWMNNPYAKGPANPDQDKLRAYLDRMNGQKQKPDGMMDLLQGNQRSSSMLGLAALFNRSANMAGSINGKVASNEGIENFVAGAQRSNDGMTREVQQAQKEQKQKADEKLKGMMFLAKQEQDKQKYSDDLSFRAKQLEGLTGYRDKSLEVQDRRNELDSGYKNDMLKATQGNKESTQQYRNDLLKLKEKEIGAKVDAAKNKPAAQDPETLEYVKKMSADNAKKISGLNTVKNLRTEFNKIDPKNTTELKRFAEKMAKAMQSADFGSDAINGTDAERLLGYFNQVRAGDILSDGTAAFGRNPAAFKADVDRQIKYLEGTVGDNTKEVAAIRRGAVPGQTSINSANASGPAAALPPEKGGKTLKKVQRNKVTGKMRYVYTDGSVEEK